MSPGFRPPVTLEGTRIRLVPLAPEQAESLVATAADRGVFEFLSYGPYNGVDAVRGHIHELLRRQSLGTDLAFTILRKSDSVAVGMTRFLNIERENEAVEIGGSWLDRRYWRSPYNTESKRLLLGHAFDVEHVHRVAIQTDLRNERSQRAIERIGGQREGVHRENRIVRDGYRRSSVVYSILADEWPELGRRLDAWIARPWREPVGDEGQVSGG
jgi:RimJ/RimL family protein N-acetyltransferase